MKIKSILIGIAIVAMSISVSACNIHDHETIVRLYENPQLTGREYDEPLKDLSVPEAYGKGVCVIHDKSGLDPKTYYAACSAVPNVKIQSA